MAGLVCQFCGATPVLWGSKLANWIWGCENCKHEVEDGSSWARNQKAAKQSGLCAHDLSLLKDRCPDCERLAAGVKLRDIDDGGDFSPRFLTEEPRKPE